MSQLWFPHYLGQAQSSPVTVDTDSSVSCKDPEDIPTFDEWKRKVMEVEKEKSELFQHRCSPSVDFKAVIFSLQRFLLNSPVSPHCQQRCSYCCEEGPEELQQLRFSGVRGQDPRRQPGGQGAARSEPQPEKTTTL